MNLGKVVKIQGGVVDVAFANAAPQIQELLYAGDIPLEVMLMRDQGVARCMALAPVRGLGLGTEVKATGAPIKVPVKDLQANWSAFSQYPPEQRKRLCNSLGNLLAISRSDNASLSNDCFIHKVDQSNKGDTHKNLGYRYDSMSAQVVAINNTWTPESIKNRGISMLKSMLAMLDEPEDLLDEGELLKLLGLEFMAESVKEKDHLHD